MKLLLLLLCAAPWFAGPLNPWPADWGDYLGRSVTVEGTAQNAKLGALVQHADRTLWVDLAEWPDATRGKKVRVTGRIESRNDLPLTDDPHSGGMTGPSRQRYLLTNPATTVTSP